MRAARGDPPSSIVVLTTGPRRWAAERLAEDGFWVVPVEDREELLRAMASVVPDMVMLEVRAGADRDLGLLEAARRADPSGDVTMIVFSGADGALGGEARVAAFNHGADDVIPEWKVIAHDELLCRVRALLRRRGHGTVITAGPVEVDLRAREARLRGRPISLTPREFALLQRLAIAPRRVHRKDELLAEVWGWAREEANGTNTLEVHASRLRRKLSRDGDDLVITVRGVGYRLL
ncbi:MAG TPA: response regulator transcription factor [Conexibacter sp.]